jgi:hypothetical protein
MSHATALRAEQSTDRMRGYSVLRRQEKGKIVSRTPKPKTQNPRPKTQDPRPSQPAGAGSRCLSLRGGRADRTSAALRKLDQDAEFRGQSTGAMYVLVYVWPLQAVLPL